MSLVINAVSKTFGGSRILHDVSLSVPTGAITGMIGPNGAGKSSLFAVIGGTIEADAGKVEFEGEDMLGRPPQARARLGLVRTFQVPRPFPHLTVRDNLAVAAPGQSGEGIFNALLGGMRVRTQEQKIRERAGELIDFLKLTPVADTPAGQLSGGQRKLLELGRAMMIEPKLVLLDEPFAGVNPVLFGEISDRIRELNQSGIGFFIIEHNIRALARLVDALHVLNHGALLASGTPDEVLSQPAVRDAYMGGGGV